jgi:hypothetical protein
MALNTTIVKPVESTPTAKPDYTAEGSALLSMLMLSVYAAGKSKKSLRKLKRQFAWNTLKLKVKSFFDRKAVSDRTLIYILLGVALLALLFIEPIAALVVVLVALILILAGVI